MGEHVVWLVRLQVWHSTSSPPWSQMLQMSSCWCVYRGHRLGLDLRGVCTGGEVVRPQVEVMVVRWGGDGLGLCFFAGVRGRGGLLGVLTKCMWVSVCCGGAGCAMRLMSRCTSSSVRVRLGACGLIAWSSVKKLRSVRVGCVVVSWWRRVVRS
jgi:hypothetical protein